MTHLLAAKRALHQGGQVIACTHDPMGHGTNFRVIAIRREAECYYGMDVENKWYPISEIVSILAKGKDDAHNLET